MSEKTVMIDGVEYAPVPKMDSKNRVIVRSRDSGVHFGTLKSRDGTEVTLTDSRRIWYWAGAASLSELALSGVSKPDECKFTVVVPGIVVLGVCEIIKCTAGAAKCIEEVPTWKIQ